MKLSTYPNKSDSAKVIIVALALLFTVRFANAQPAGDARRRGALGSGGLRRATVAAAVGATVGRAATALKSEPAALQPPNGPMH